MRKIKSRSDAIRGFAILSFVVGTSSAIANTSYKTIEINSELRFFSHYAEVAACSDWGKLDGLEQSLAWKAALKKHLTTFETAKVLRDGVILKNEKFNFQIQFAAKISDRSITWRCHISDGSWFFKPKQCDGWEKIVERSSCLASK